VAPEIFKAFESIAAKCADMGHLVEEAAPKYDYDEFTHQLHKKERKSCSKRLKDGLPIG